MLDGRFRFENFVVGASNRLAVAAVRKIAEAPASAGGVAAICGPSGVGKTHLLTALGHVLVEQNPGIAIGYLAAIPLMEDLHTAIATGQVELLLAEYAQWDVLLLDDVHQLSGRFETQYELIPVLSALHRNRRRIVLTSDRRPAELADLDDRLRACIVCDTVVELGLPEVEMRVGILRRFCEERAATLDDATLQQIAAAAVQGHDLAAAIDGVAAPKPAPRVDAFAPIPDPAESLLADTDTPPATDPPALTSDPILTPPSSPTATPPDSPTPTPARPPWPVPVTSKPTPRAGTPAARLTPRPPSPNEFENFVVEVASAVSMSVDKWRARIADVSARWAAEGFRTTMFERALNATPAPDWGALEARFAACADRLRGMEREAARLDPRLAGLPVFRDPERLEDAEKVLLRAFAAYDPPPGPNPKLKIDNFVAGERNQRALRDVSDVIGVPGTRFNPFCLWGPTGAGKTHLLSAIGNALTTHDGGGWTVACVSVAALIVDLRDALHAGTLERWRARYRCADALLLDDVHLLSREARAQDEVLRLTTALIEAGKQVVVTAGAPPAQLSGLSAALRKQLEGGQAVEIGRVPESERVARHTPVPDGAEAAAPTIDAWFDEGAEPTPPGTATAPIPALGGVDSFFLDPEKCLTDWPSIDGRVIEDPR